MTKMTLEQAKIRIAKLRKIIDKLRYHYHVLDDPSVTDAEYDSLMHELIQLEEKFPSLLDPTSPSQKVGGEALKKFERKAHLVPMLSLNDAFSFEELKGWQEKMGRLVGPEKIRKVQYYCEMKMDGLAVSLVYKNGILAYALTRGDGTIGEDITENIKTIRSIPLRLRRESSYYKETVGNRIEIRGEVYMPRKSFEHLNQERIHKGLPAFANPRNAAAGSLRQLDPRIAAARQLGFMAYALLGIPTDYHQEEHLIAKDLGFPVNKYNHLAKDLTEIEKIWQDWGKLRPELPYQVDGMVVNINEEKLFKALGIVGKAPRGSLAFKWPAEEVTTKISRIELQVGRTGVLTPTAHFDSVKVAGSTVSRATLHNEEEIRKKDIRTGDTVVIRKAGDIIPEVVKSIKELRTGEEKIFKMPKKCPICGGSVVKRDGEVASYCSNKNCFAIEKEKIIHFVSKAAFDIEGLGEKIVEQLLTQGVISDASDLFKLKIDDLLPLEKFAALSAHKLVDSINDHKKITLPRLIYALGIRHIGEVTAYDLAQKFSSLNQLMLVGEDELMAIEGIGEKSALSIAQWFSDTKNQRFINELLEAGIKIVSGKGSQALAGKNFVITGTLENLSREKAEERIRALGGKAHSNVSADTDYLVLGNNPGSKYAKAAELGIKIINEEDFLKMLG